MQDTITNPKELIPLCQVNKENVGGKKPIERIQVYILLVRSKLTSLPYSWNVILLGVKIKENITKKCIEDYLKQGK